MRGIKSIKMTAWAIGLIAMTGQMTSALAQRTNIFPNTHEWKYMVTASDTAFCLNGTGWETSGYDDSAWPSAPGGFTGGETSAAALLGVTTTTLPAPTPSQGRPMYFRTHFSVGPVSGLSLTLSNRIDDQAVFYVNGTRVADYRHPDNPEVCDPGGAGGDEASVWIVITLTAQQLSGILQQGDNVLAVSMHQNATGSSDMVFVCQLWGESSTPVEITDSTGLADQTVATCTEATLSVGASGSSPITFQWLKDGFEIDSTLNPTATNASLVITNLSLLDAGNYTVRVMNPLATITSSPATVITVVPDSTPPTVLAASGEADLITYIVTFSEPMDPSSVVDTFGYAIRTADNSEQLFIDAITVSNATQIIMTTTTTPRDPSKDYVLVVNPAFSFATIREACNLDNIVAEETTVPIVPALLFQQNLNGYTGTQDAELHSNATADTPLGANPTLTVDLDDAGVAQALLRFDNVFGNGPGQVPLGSVIVSATLTINNFDPGDIINVHRMLIGWDQATVTWNSMGNGVQADDVEARMAIETTIPTGPGIVSIDVLASVQAWANGAPNHGWAFLATGGNGFDMDTSEGGIPPQLRIIYSLQPCSALSIVTQPAPTTTVNEGSPFTLSVTVDSPGCPATFQWTKDGMNIDNATNAEYSVTSAIPSDAGVYQVTAMNASPSSEMSMMATVMVNVDTVRPVLVSAAGSTNPALVNLTFSEPISIATGGNPANYALVPVGGGAPLTINNATVSGSNIVLSTAPRVFGTSYQLTISGLSDATFSSNPINPNPTVVNPLPQDVLILGYTTTDWSYNTNCQDGVNWNAADFDDSSWPTGKGVFGLETSAATLASLPGGAIVTPLPVGAGDATNVPPIPAQIAFYFRTSFDFPYDTTGVQFHLNHFIDDGAVIYVNGAPSVTYNANTNPIPPFCTNLFDQPTGGDASLVQTNLNGVASGQNVVAVEVHQSTLGSSDVIFAIELIARVTSFSAPGPRLTITVEPGGTQARIQWNPAQGTLQFKNNLDDPTWTDVESGGNVVVPLTEMRRFYTVRQ